MAQKSISEEKMMSNMHRAVMPSLQSEENDNLANFIKNNIRYPLKPLLYGKNKGKVIVSYTISADGDIKNAKVIYSSDKSYSKEVFRLLNSTGKWTPGTWDSKNVNVKCNLTVEFNSPLHEDSNLRQAKVFYNGDLLPQNKIWYMADYIYLDQLCIINAKYSKALLGSNEKYSTIIINTEEKHSTEILRKLQNIDTNFYSLHIDDNQVDLNTWNKYLSAKKAVKFNIIAENNIQQSKFRAFLYTY
ncbi:energy transducer TonB [Sphingobacterium bovistauri]|uniref:Energy transducer TonB n=1 Tax=Sphingobacterium bovistauri TaxID=2781959 RepID=A0ABS7Z5R3_9SPHI|nr:energy transducer TonB [Sphingobacterium bovistauri]MCA5004922.1 energy transducer TonB [Sphingobacterium bovistauri]